MNAPSRKRASRKKASSKKASSKRASSKRTSSKRSSKRASVATRNSFKVTTNTNLTWSCPIHCHTCEFVRPSGVRCKNRVCFGSPLCWIHNVKKYKVKAATSTIPNAGKGLFATEDFQRNDWICPMTGEKISMACVEMRYPGDMTAPYAEEMQANQAVDCACSRGIGSTANAHFLPNGNVRGRSAHNAITRHRPVGQGIPGIWLKADKRIKAGDEIFLWYGDSYKLEDNHTTKRRREVPDSRPC